MGQVVDSKQVEEMPLNGRNPINLAALDPAVVPQGDTTGSAAQAGVNGVGNYQMGGGTADQSATYLDGTNQHQLCEQHSAAPYSGLNSGIPSGHEQREPRIRPVRGRRAEHVDKIRNESVARRSVRNAFGIRISTPTRSS